MTIETPVWLRVGTAVQLSVILSAFGILTSLPAAADSQAVERGRYLVEGVMACGNCHSPRDADGNVVAERNLSGGLTFDTPAFTVTTPNITPDPETGIGTWSDDEIKRAIVEGVRPDHGPLAGAELAAIMPVNFYKALTPSDLDAVVAYLRSVPPVRNEVPEPLYKLPVMREPYPDAERSYSEADLRDPVTRGTYLATLGHCMECHATRMKGVPDYAHGFGRGGFAFLPAMVKGYPASWQGSVAANITSHPAVGIGGWSDGEIRRAIKDGYRRDGRRLQAPMAWEWYGRISEEDVAALVAWLRTIPPLE